ncbi:MAG: tripartite tricarboxylate transporter TctB family protein [Pseudomonadota bacterium]
MTTRAAELLMALLMSAFSIYLMWKSTELEIGWVPEEGPGGGFWPFWLAAVMLISCIWIIVNWARRLSPPARDESAFFGTGVIASVGGVAAALIFTVWLFDGRGVPGFDGLGVYLALPLFLLFYMKVMGDHSLPATLFTMVIVPVLTFLFFEVMLSITLPKGMTDAFFSDHIFARVYACPSKETWGEFFMCLVTGE